VVRELNGRYNLREKGNGLGGSVVPLAKAVEALVRDEKPVSELERPLRLFQLRYWLIDDEETQVSFRDAGLLFCAATIRQEARTLRQRFRGAGGFELMLLTISRQRLRWLINEVFGRKYTIYDLTKTPLIPYDDQKAQKTKNEIQILNALTRFRLRLNETNGFEPSLNNSTQLLYRSKLEESCSPTTSKEIERRRRERSAFAFVAAEYGNSTSGLLDVYLDVVTEYTESFDSAESQDHKENVLRDYFARLKYILPTVNEESADELVVAGLTLMQYRSLL
jgi:hypothetical protein